MNVDVIAVSLISGLFGAVLATAANLVVQDKRMKRDALRDFFRRHRFIAERSGLAANSELFNEVFVSFSGSRAVRRLLKKRRSGDARYTQPLIKAMCQSAWVRYDEFLMGCDLEMLSK